MSTMRCLWRLRRPNESTPLEFTAARAGTGKARRGPRGLGPMGAEHRGRRREPGPWDDRQAGDGPQDPGHQVLRATYHHEAATPGPAQAGRVTRYLERRRAARCRRPITNAAASLHADVMRGLTFSRSSWLSATPTNRSPGSASARSRISAGVSTPSNIATLTKTVPADDRASGSVEVLRLTTAPANTRPRSARARAVPRGQTAAPPS